MAPSTARALEEDVCKCIAIEGYDATDDGSDGSVETDATDSTETNEQNAADGTDGSVEVDETDASNASEAPLHADCDGSGDTVEVYLGNGCFWHTQYDLFLVETKWGRPHERISSRIGYAGGTLESPDGLVCYHRGPVSLVTKLLLKLIRCDTAGCK